MIIQIKIKTFTKFDFSTFQRATIKGCYLPDNVGALPEEYYNVKGVIDPDNPKEDGIYAMQIESCWIDMRPQYLGKNILRIKGDIELKLIKRV